MTKMRRNKGTSRITVTRRSNGASRTTIMRKRDGASMTVVKGCNGSFIGWNKTATTKKSRGGQHVNNEEELLEQFYDHYLHVYQYLPRGMGYPWYQENYQGYR